MKHILARDIVDILLYQLYNESDLESKNEVVKAIQGLVKENVLRFTGDYHVTWHSQIVRYVISNDPDILK